MFSSTIQRLNDRRDGVEDSGQDAGFTLIELMVVLLILAILLAIAIPTFLGVTKSANDRAAQSNLNTALVNAKAAFQSNGQSYGIGGSANSTSFSTSFVATLSSAEPALSFTTGASTTLGQISVAVAPDGNGIVLASQAKGTGNCWYVIDNALSESATSNPPYTGMSGAAIAAGTAYGENKNTGTAPTCTAATLPTTGTTSFVTTGFPNL